MANYKKMYLRLFAAVMEAMEIMDRGLEEADEIYMSEKGYSLTSFLNHQQKIDDFNKKK